MVIVLGDITEAEVMDELMKQINDIAARYNITWQQAFEVMKLIKQEEKLEDISRNLAGLEEGLLEVSEHLADLSECVVHGHNLATFRVYASVQTVN